MRSQSTPTNLLVASHFVVWASPIVPLHQIQTGCDDPRHPAIYNKWMSSCGPDGSVSQLVHLESDLNVDLPNGLNEWVSVQFWVGGLQGGLWMAGELDEQFRLSLPVRSPATVSDRYAVGLGESEVWIKSIKSQSIVSVKASPKPWQSPALLDEQVAWVNDDGQGGADIWKWSQEEGAIPLATGPSWQHGVVSFSRHWAWLEPDHVVIYNVETATVRKINAKVVDGLTVFEDGVCWSALNQQDLDVYCSDGFSLERAGHQRWPYRSDGVLIFREQQEVMKWIIPPKSP